MATVDERIKHMALPVDLSKDKSRAQYGTFQSEDSQSGLTDSISPTIEQLLQEMNSPIHEPLSAIDAKIINKIVKAYERQVSKEDEASGRGVKRKRESEGADTTPHKRSKESVSEAEYKQLMDEARQLKRQGDENKHEIAAVDYYVDAALVYARATLAPHLVASVRQELYRGTANMLAPSVTRCEQCGDDWREAMCLKAMAWCHAQAFLLQRTQLERDVRRLNELKDEERKAVTRELSDLFRSLEYWDRARRHERSAAQTSMAHPLDLSTHEFVAHITQLRDMRK